MKKLVKLKALFIALLCMILCVTGIPVNASAATKTYSRTVLVPPLSDNNWGKSSSFKVSAGDKIGVSWSSGTHYAIKLKNDTTGNCTTIKDGTGYVKWTGLRAGNYHVYVVYDGPDRTYYDEPCYVKSMTCIKQKFSVEKN